MEEILARKAKRDAPSGAASSGAGADPAAPSATSVGPTGSSLPAPSNTNLKQSASAQPDAAALYLVARYAGWLATRAGAQALRPAASALLADLCGPGPEAAAAAGAVVLRGDGTREASVPQGTSGAEGSCDAIVRAARVGAQSLEGRRSGAAQSVVPLSREERTCVVVRACADVVASIMQPRAGALGGAGPASGAGLGGASDSGHNDTSDLTFDAPTAVTSEVGDKSGGPQADEPGETAETGRGLLQDAAAAGSDAALLALPPGLGDIADALHCSNGVVRAAFALVLLEEGQDAGEQGDKDSEPLGLSVDGSSAGPRAGPARGHGAAASADRGQVRQRRRDMARSAGCGIQGSLRAIVGRVWKRVSECCRTLGMTPNEAGVLPSVAEAATEGATDALGSVRDVDAAAKEAGQALRCLQEILALPGVTIARVLELGSVSGGGEGDSSLLDSLAAQVEAAFASEGAHTGGPADASSSGDVVGASTGALHGGASASGGTLPSLVSIACGLVVQQGCRGACSTQSAGFAAAALLQAAREQAQAAMDRDAAEGSGFATRSLSSAAASVLSKACVGALVSGHRGGGGGRRRAEVRENQAGGGSSDGREEESPWLSLP